MVENNEDKKAEDKKVDPYEAMLKEFDAKQSDFSSRIKVAAAAFKNTRTLLEAEHILYDVRQDLVDYKRKLVNALSGMNKDLKKMKNARMLAHKEGKIALLPANPTEKKIIDDAYFSAVVETIEKFDNQYDWAKASIDTCDEMSNGISYYVKLANLLGGN